MTTAKRLRQNFEVQRAKLSPRPSKAQVAEEATVSVTSIDRLGSGTQIGTLEKIAGALGCSVGALVAGLGTDDWEDRLDALRDALRRMSSDVDP